ncbi:Nramp family divalent metal transporter [Ascidiimonas sp. W6]|uniref:Nramp family divalent metal transporter n=1 Tax=Ascidiimonas meishanensis TaxID=3128903 RepID=UPI0030EB1E67
MLKNTGPGALVAAAFIGPGTVTICTVAGVQFGTSLLWAMLLSVLATAVLQEMAARLGVVTQKGLAEIIKEQLTNSRVRSILLGLIIIAIVLGNAAYEAGNISGAVLGVEAVFGTEISNYASFLIAGIAFLLLFTGNYKTLERSLVGLVILMSLSFVVTAILTGPSIVKVLKGIFVPALPDKSLLTVIGLVGTTIVPYNLFLHASLVKEKWSSFKDLDAVKKDTYISVFLGGLVSISIMVAASGLQIDKVKNAMDLALGLEPLYGQASRYFLGIGLFAAGITSAVTAPLAAAYVVNSIFGWNAGLKDYRFRWVWVLILVLGLLFMSFKITPIQMIRVAQIANGLLLPVIAIFLVWVVNRPGVLGAYKNTFWNNLIAILIVVVTLVLGIKGILKVMGITIFS